MRGLPVGFGKRLRRIHVQKPVLVVRVNSHRRTLALEPATHTALPLGHLTVNAARQIAMYQGTQGVIIGP